jgi:predicted amidohydrolase
LIEDNVKNLPMNRRLSFLAIFFLSRILGISLIVGQSAAIPGKAVQEIRLAGLQMLVGSDINKNKDQILQGITYAAREGATFLVTPEGSLSGYTSNFNQAELSNALEEVKAAARKMKIGLMLGTCFKEDIKGKEFCFNQVRVYAPEGQYLGAYSKILRCSELDVPGTGEMAEYAEGTLRTFEWEGCTFGILICNDLWATPGYTTMPNPYLPWKLQQMGAQFIVHSINSGTAQKYKPFHESSAELWALSLHIPIMEVNAAQEERINAQSGLIDAQGQRILRVPDTGTQFFTVGLTPGNTMNPDSVQAK